MKSIKPLIGIVENIRRELSWGLTFPRSTFIESNIKDSTVDAFQAPALELGHAILTSMEATRKVILEVYHHTKWSKSSLLAEKDAVHIAKEKLLSARNKARSDLRQISNDYMHYRAPSNAAESSPAFLNMCLFIISLLQVRACKISHFIIHN